MRIVSLAPSNTEILFALGVGDQVVGVTHFCDWPSQVSEKTKVGSWIQTDPKKIAALKPDLIMTSYYLPDPLKSWSGPGSVVHVVPKTLADVYESILHIGDAVGARGRALDIVDEMKRDFAEIAASTTGVARPRVYMEEWHDPPMASGNWVPELVEIAGGVAGVSIKGAPSAVFSFEALTQFDPDLMVFHWCGIPEHLFSKIIPRRVQKWKELRAMRNGATIFLEDSLLNRPGPRLVEGARRLHKVFQDAELI